MTNSERASVGDGYVLATGDEGAARLDLLDEVYGASSRAVCAAAGLGAGWPMSASLHPMTTAECGGVR
jgi:hypothetical protein